MRKLVTLRSIKDIKPIANADAIELAIIDGWQVVTKKDEFQVGEPCVFFEIDSWLPADDDRFAFLAKTGVKKDPSGRERIRLRTVKLRKTLSQGLALPWHMFPELHEPARIHDDLSDFIDVIKFERPEPKAPEAAGSFPDGLIPKTDEERIQNVFDEYSDQYHDVTFTPTLKLDGSSCTVAYLGLNLEGYWKDGIDDFFDHEGLQEKVGEIIVCSRNLQLKYDENSHYWRATEDTVIDAMRELGKIGNFAIQGEVMGPGIQGNKEKFNTFRFFAFALYDIDNQCYIDWPQTKKMLNDLDVETVPEVDKPMKPFCKFSDLDSLLEFADGPSINAKYREGIVWKSNGIDDQITFKTISNKFLLKGGDE